MDQDIIEAVAADAEALRAALHRKGFGDGQVQQLVTAAMPEIIRYETGVLRMADTGTIR